jgi:hypothetical protein
MWRVPSRMTARFFTGFCLSTAFLGQKIALRSIWASLRYGVAVGSARLILVLVGTPLRRERTTDNSARIRGDRAELVTVVDDTREIGQ